MLDGEKNCVWYYITVQSDGLMGFEITPNISSNDYDWVVYNMTDARCEDIYAQANQLQVSCNWSATSGVTGPNGNGTTNCQNSTGSPFCAMIPVQAGESYVINISNWSPTNQSGYSLDFSMSTAQIYDDVAPEISEIFDDDVQGCNTNTIAIQWSENVLCERVEPSYFEITGPGGPYVVTDVEGIACELGGTWEKDYILFVDPPFASNGDYLLHVYTLFPGIVDACDNPAESDSIPFTLDLGAPGLDTSSMVIGAATCGMENGSITGLSASGQTSLSYIWKNSYGSIVGTEIDLIDVPSEFYTLEVHDLEDCITYGGPWQVSDFGAPDINDDSVNIMPSNYGVNNGSITGIEVSSPVSISEFIWSDDQGTQVGMDLDLIDVASGYYDLTIVDENTCEAHAGPYFVGEIGGPLTADPSASPSIICAGEQTTLAPGAGGGSGAYDYSWTSTPAGFTSTLANPVVNPLQTTTYHLALSDGYITAYGDVLVTVNQLPEPYAGEDQVIAHGISTILEGSASIGSGDYNYYWAPVEKLVDAAVQNPQTKNLYETTPFFLTVVDDQTGCESAEPDEVIVQVSGGVLSTNPSSYPDSIFCMGETIFLHANAGGGSGLYTVTWTDEGGTVLSNDHSFELSIAQEGTYYFYVKVDDGYNEVYGYVVVSVDPAPEINLGNAMQYVCVHETITLDAGNPGSSYLWSNGDTNQFTTMGTTGLGYDMQYVSVEVINKEGCRSDTGVTLVFDYDYCVGIDELSDGVHLKVYPNPTNGKLNVLLEGIDRKVSLSIKNTTGAEIAIYTMQPTAGTVFSTFDMSTHPRGMYFLVVKGDNIHHVKKVLLQ
jgi:hypothetical protein